MLVRLASRDIGEEEAFTTQRTTVAEHVESVESPADEEIPPQHPHGHGLAQNMMCYMFVHEQPP